MYFFLYRQQCFKASWITTVLHEGLKFPKSYHSLRSVQYIQNKEVQWTLGALLHRTRYLPLRYVGRYCLLLVRWINYYLLDTYKWVSDYAVWAFAHC